MLTLNEFRDVVYECPAPGTPVCELYTGNSILEDIDADDDFTRPALLFVAILLFFRISSAVALRFIRFRPTAMSSKTSGKKSKRQLRKLEKIMNNDIKLEVTELERPQVTISLKAVNLFVKTRKWWKPKDAEYKKILNNIDDIHIKPGRLFAIMGGSGSGKTSLLNLIGGRVVNVKMDGQILFNGQEPSNKELKSLVGYVTQNDYLLPALTVRETLTYAALMRLPPSMEKSEKLRRVEDVIQELGLKECAETRIGDETVRGVSGGEKRRVSIGIQLITDPSILLLDEPTSGLDSFTANRLVASLSRIAQRNRTVILSIHQPRSDIYTLMDDVFILTKGNIAYCGPRENTLDYFSSLGFNCPEHTNPADFFLDITSVDLRNARAEEESRDRVKTIVEAYAKIQEKVSSSSPSDEVKSTITLSRDREREMAPFSLAFPLLVKRGFSNIIRTPPMTSARLSQVAGFGLILCLFYSRLGDDYYSVQNRIGLLYEMIAPLLFTGMLNCIAVFPTERNVFYREKSDGAYSSHAFLASYMVNEIPFEIVTVLIYTALVMPAVGLQSSPDRFFSNFFVNLCLVFSGESFGIIFCGIFYTIGFSVTVTSVVLSWFCAMTGFISITMPDFLQAINHISIMKFGFAAINEFTDITFTCTPEQQLADGSCPFTNGDQVLTTYEFNPDNKWQSFGLVIVLAVIYRAICFIVFKFFKRQFSQ